MRNANFETVTIYPSRLMSSVYAAPTFIPLNILTLGGNVPLALHYYCSVYFAHFHNVECNRPREKMNLTAPICSGFSVGALNL